MFPKAKDLGLDILRRILKDAITVVVVARMILDYEIRSLSNYGNTLFARV